MSKVFLTGITGFVGKNTARELIKHNHQVIALIRPETPQEKIQEFAESVEFVRIDLCNIPALASYLADNSFDVIMHVGAIRGGKNRSREEYFTVNVKSTEQLMVHCLEKDSRFIFCSSVGVFGGAPLELPATENTPRQNDSYYHFTKIHCESLLQNYVLKGLKAAVVRPSIIYGIGDYGFAYNLTRLVDKGIMFLANRPVLIHLTHVMSVVEAMIKLIKINYISGNSYNVADKNPVYLKELVDFINNRLKGNPYPDWKHVNYRLLLLGEKFFRFLKNELWINRFEFIVKDRHYDISNTIADLSLTQYNTIPDFKIVTDWYKFQRGK